MARAATTSDIPNLVCAVSPCHCRPDSPLLKDSLVQEIIGESKRLWKLLSDEDSPILTRTVTDLTDTDTEPESNSSQSWVRVIVSDDEPDGAETRQRRPNKRVLRSASTQTDSFPRGSDSRPEVVWTPMLTTCYLPQLRYGDGQLIPLLDAPLVRRPPRV